MVTPAPSTVMLSCDSPEYKAHKGEIKKIIDLATRLGMLSARFRDALITEAGIVCEVPGDNMQNCVAKSYFGLAIKLPKNPSKSNKMKLERTGNKRELIESVLAMRLSIMDCVAQKNFDEDYQTFPAYKEMIADIEDYCFQKGITSLLPNMFIPASLFTQLKKEDYDISKEGRPELYTKLSQLFAWQDRHFHTLVTRVYRQGHWKEALQMINEVMQARGADSVLDLFQSNFILAETYVGCLFELKDYNALTTLCRQIGEENVAGNIVLTEKYLRSLVGKLRIEDVQQFIVAYHAQFPEKQNRHIIKTLLFAYVDVGWMLYGNGEPEQAIEFINQYCPPELQEHEDVVNLLKQLNQQVGTVLE